MIASVNALRLLAGRRPFPVVKPEEIDFGSIETVSLQPCDLEREGSEIRMEELRAEINRDNGEIAYWTNLRDQHVAMLAGEEAKAKVLAAFTERQGAPKMAAE
jgi:hypothetical protein